LFKTVSQTRHSCRPWQNRFANYFEALNFFPHFVFRGGQGFDMFQRHQESVDLVLLTVRRHAVTRDRNAKKPVAGKIARLDPQALGRHFDLAVVPGPIVDFARGGPLAPSFCWTAPFFL
jgi:hypothetical protein